MEQRTVGGNQVDAADGLDLQRPRVPAHKLVETQEDAVQEAQPLLGRALHELLAVQDCARLNTSAGGPQAVSGISSGEGFWGVHELPQKTHRLKADCYCLAKNLLGPG